VNRTASRGPLTAQQLLARAAARTGAAQRFLAEARYERHAGRLDHAAVYARCARVCAQLARIYVNTADTLQGA
jgi:hypothetical protein